MPVVASRGGTVLGVYSDAQTSCSDKAACTEEQFYCCVESSGGEICTAGAGAKIGDACHAAAECDSSPGAGDGQCRCIANAVSIEHADGSVGQYDHMGQNEVSVSDGDLVLRGDEIGKTGNTGCSTGPHVHFHTIGKAGPGDAWQKATREMRFQTAGGATCVIPKTKDKNRSNNGIWMGF